ncbi:hypothetical protein GGE24_005572 [Bradyrhizobium centrosematis]|nr:hypothetical protein [Bradyrhizobium centrosematis]MCS3776216.1 hypothetical protein [Bradyrhizobium centrosematis]
MRAELFGRNLAPTSTTRYFGHPEAVMLHLNAEEK